MFARRVAHLRSDQSGGSAVEFAIVSPFLIILIVGIFACGWAIHCVASVRYALEQSGRTLTVNPTMTADEFDTLVKSKLASLADSNVTTSLTTDAPSGGVKLAHASATYSFTIDIPMLPEQAITYQTSIVVPLSSL